MEALHDTTGMRAFRDVQTVIERDSAAVRAALGEEAFAVVWAEGRAMTLDQAVAYALS